MSEVAQQFGLQVAELKKMVVAQNAKIASLTATVAVLKQNTILKAVSERVAATGHGGTE